MNKGLLRFRELASYWLVKMPYLESVLLGEQIVRLLGNQILVIYHVRIFLERLRETTVVRLV